MKSFVVLCERTCLRGSWFPFFFLIFCLMFTFPFGHLAVRQGTFFSGSQILLSCFPVHSYSVHLDASHWNLEFFGFTQTTFFVHPKNSRFQCSASRFTEYFVHRKKNSRICSPEKNSLSHRQMSIRKSLHQKKEKKWKTAPPKARPYTRTTKSFSLPRKRQEQTNTWHGPHKPNSIWFPSAPRREKKSIYSRTHYSVFCNTTTLFKNNPYYIRFTCRCF